MKCINFVFKLTDKKALALVLRQQAEMAIAENGDVKSKPPYPKVIQKLLVELAEIKEKK